MKRRGGLVYYNYRYYNPELGRWISRDPIEEQGGYNLYGMIGNNPLYGWDDLGRGLHEWWCTFVDWLTKGKKVYDSTKKIDDAREKTFDPKASPKEKSDADHDAIKTAARNKAEENFVDTSKEVTGSALEEMGNNINKRNAVINDLLR